MSGLPKLSILIPTWNSLDRLKLCLKSIGKHSELPLQVVVHVNDGRDGTLDWVKRRNIDFTHTPRNVGICRALNNAFQKSDAEYLVYLNDDMYVLPGWDTALYARAARAGERELLYTSGTMIQSVAMSPSVVIGDYGADFSSFDEAKLMQDFTSGKLSREDWNGATWPPSCIHRKWWEVVGGYSEEFSPGFYSDIDFSMKLWQAGCRRFHGVGSSLVYHFGEKTTGRVRGQKNESVRRARLQFLGKWGILPSTFSRYYLRVSAPHLDKIPEPALRWESVRLSALSVIHRPLPTS